MPSPLIQESEAAMKKAVAHLQFEFTQIQAGRANAAMVENLLIEAYGSTSPLKNNAQISIPEPQTIAIQPWDRSLLSQIEKSIRNSSLGVNPVNDGTGVIRINVPALTEDRRRDLVKVVNAKAEEGRVAVRKIRQDFLQDIRAQEGVSEDLIKNEESDLQEVVNKANKEIDEITKQKEADIMKV
ncbi:MAG TPA: ribosome recycling factor [Candidatus Gracilibacteria bacterium]|nr:ribosome recycling factor [Candidatus Gracilibacteria bacterium]